jgi:hypothetical protein
MERGRAKDRATWYQPLEAMDDIRPSVHWVLGRPGIFLLSPGDVGILPLVLDAASEPMQLPGPEVMAALSQRAGFASIFGL